MGVAALEVRNTEEILVINVNSLDEDDLRELVDLFDRLDSETRKLCGADK